MALSNASLITGYRTDEYYEFRITSIKALAEELFKVVVSPVQEKILFIPGQYAKIICHDSKSKPYSIGNTPKGKEAVISATGLLFAQARHIN